jgi:hypothetical protein
MFLKVKVQLKSEHDILLLQKHEHFLQKLNIFDDKELGAITAREQSN